jgi:hypothetical protein
MRHGEKYFEFYEAKTGADFDSLREAVNSWISEFPAMEQDEIVKRLKKVSNEDFEAGIAELILYVVLKRAQYSVEVHPETPTKKKIDFKFAKGEFGAFVESTSFAPSREKIAGDNREAQIYNSIEKANIPDNVSFGYSVRTRGNECPNLKTLVAAIEKWAGDNKANSERPSRVFNAGDWEIELDIFIRSVPKQDPRNIAASIGEARWIAGHLEIRDALNEKKDRYGSLNAPFVIAVTDCKEEMAGGHLEELVAALFGDDAYRIVDGQLKYAGKSANGFWGTAENPRNSHVSAVLLIPSAKIWAFRAAQWQPLLVLNPWAAHALPNGSLPLNTYWLNGSTFEMSTGNLADALGLPDPWPP